MEEIENFLLQGELRKALESLHSVVKSNTTAQLLGRLSSLEKEIDNGTIEPADIRLTKNRIMNSARSVLERNPSKFKASKPLEEQNLEEKSPPDEKVGNSESKEVPLKEQNINFPRTYKLDPEIKEKFLSDIKDRRRHVQEEKMPYELNEINELKTPYKTSPSNDSSSPNPKNKIPKQAVGILVGMLLFSVIGWGINQLRQTSLSDYAGSLKPNVVKITSSFGDGKSENGFGFITGEKDGVLYIITAKHVVISSNVSALDRLDSRAEEISVEFEPEPRKNYAAEFILESETLDLALIEVQKSGIDWIRPAADFDPQKSEAVTFIGKNDEWYIPEEAGSGSINSNIDELVVDINSVESGTSGAPLVTKEGIVGLIYKTNRSRAWAVSLEDIRKFVLYDVFGGRLDEAFLLKE